MCSSRLNQPKLIAKYLDLFGLIQVIAIFIRSILPYQEQQFIRTHTISLVSQFAYKQRHF